MSVTVLTRPARLRLFTWRHPEWSAALLAVAAWVLLSFAHSDGFTLVPEPSPTPAGHSDHLETLGSTGANAPRAWLAGAASWVLMVTAMMVPTALPGARYVALNSLWARRYRAIALFLGGYLGVWMALGAAAVLMLVLRPQVFHRAPRELLPILLVIAAIWELTPWKRRSLRACFKMSPLPPRGAKADVACTRFGVRHGLPCVTGCWALMSVMVVAGHVSLWLMALLAIVVGLEKLLARETGLRAATAMALLIAAVTLKLGTPFTIH